MSLTLQQIDEMLASAPGFRVVGPIQIDESGVDPIGLRQLNLDLMDATVPGISNVTVHVRPYAFMAWAWWKAGIVATENGEIQPQKMRDLVMRYEAMYAWAHSLAEHPLRGVGVIRRYLPLKGSEEAFIFSGEKWETLKGRMTSLMAPTEYGPSIKALRWLAPSDGSTFRRSLEVESAVMAIEKIVAEHVPQHLLALKAPAATWEDVFPFAEYLHITKPTREERDAFRFLFYEVGAKPHAPKEIQRRMATIDLLRGIFSKEGHPIDLPTIRRRLVTGWLPDDWQHHESDIQTSSVLLSILQARQLQRLAIESMMMWVERSLSTEVAKAQPTEDLAAAADAAAKKADPLVLAALRVGEYMDAVEKLGAEVGWPSAASDPETDVVGLMSRIYAAQRKDIFVLPGLCLRAFAVVRAVTKGVREMGVPEIAGKSLDARLDRFPMGAMSKRIDAVADKSLIYLWRDVIEHWIIAQHVHWSAIRGVDGKKRLRIGLEGNGWIRVRPQPSSGFNATPDRLFTLLSLGTECGLFTSTEDNGTTRFGVPT